MGNNFDFQFEDHSREFLEALGEQIDAGLEAVGQQAESYAKLHLESKPRRIDTGLLRNSITHAVGGKPPATRSYHASYGSKRTGKGKRKGAGSKGAGSVSMGFYGGTAHADGTDEYSVYVGTNVEYAPYVHDGTRKMSANRFISDPLQKHAGEFEQILLQYLQN